MSKRKIGRGVALVAAGMSQFGAFPGKATRDLFVEAFLDLRDRADKASIPRKLRRSSSATTAANYLKDRGIRRRLWPTGSG